MPLPHNLDHVTSMDYHCDRKIEFHVCSLIKHFSSIILFQHQSWFWKSLLYNHLLCWKSSVTWHFHQKKGPISSVLQEIKFKNGIDHALEICAHIYKHHWEQSQPSWVLGTRLEVAGVSFTKEIWWFGTCPSHCQTFHSLSSGFLFCASQISS